MVGLSPQELKCFDGTVRDRAGGDVGGRAGGREGEEEAKIIKRGDGKKRRRVFRLVESGVILQYPIKYKPEDWGCVCVKGEGRGAEGARTSTDSRPVFCLRVHFNLKSS